MARAQGRFDGKVAFVTGGATGIGFACAQAIVDGGGSVMLAGRRESPLRAA
ncbi:MAG TPA: SDR family NAD(P)-dependent oxidoreductase, partial [Myxococcota bacterium]|nr:SDR family NAD(P)-dependent oxidoreductase [Myxococcota bacterium]